MPSTSRLITQPPAGEAPIHPRTVLQPASSNLSKLPHLYPTPKVYQSSAKQACKTPRMTLASEILVQLHHTIVAMNRLTTPSPQSPMAQDERRFALTQLKSSVDVLAKLAEVAHVEALTAQASQTKAAQQGLPEPVGLFAVRK
ncbi:hypothetical protein DFP73DRAFT_635921 [Morchella snyderi]|nr:hypothetical protein DFP73DRAFT_635921 [Morchella snyderi]